MRRGNIPPLMIGSLGMILLIFDGKAAVSGVKDGLELCIQTLIPSLFPFFVLSSLVTGALSGVSVAPLRWLSRFCRMPDGADSLLLVGILGGYPVGAGNIAAEYHNGRLLLTDARRLSIFCNNAGPSFLFGILGPLFPNAGWTWALWVVQISASVLTGILLPNGSSNTVSSQDSRCVSFSEALNRGVKSMGLVCGWVIIFRLILTYLDRWILGLLPGYYSVIVAGLLELSNGCLALSGIENVLLRFVLAGIILSLGGVCVWMQTQAVFPEIRLTDYIAGRFLHCLICVVLSIIIVPTFTGERIGFSFPVFVFLPSVMTILVLILRKRKKAVAFCN